MRASPASNCAPRNATSSSSACSASNCATRSRTSASVTPMRGHLTDAPTTPPRHRAFVDCRHAWEGGEAGAAERTRLVSGSVERDRRRRAVLRRQALGHQRAAARSSQRRRTGEDAGHDAVAPAQRSHLDRRAGHRRRGVRTDEVPVVAGLRRPAQPARAGDRRRDRPAVVRRGSRRAARHACAGSRRIGTVRGAQHPAARRGTTGGVRSLPPGALRRQPRR